MRGMKSGQCRPAFTVFISPHAGKAFKISIRHSSNPVKKNERGILESCLLIYVRPGIPPFIIDLSNFLLSTTF